MVIVYGGQGDIEGLPCSGEGQVGEELFLVYLLEKAFSEDETAVPIDFLPLQLREEAPFFHPSGKFSFHCAGDEDHRRFHGIAPVHARDGYMIQGGRDGGVGKGGKAVFEDGEEALFGNPVTSCGMDDFIKKGENLLPYLQVGPKVCMEGFLFIHAEKGVRNFFLHHPLVKEAAPVLGKGLFLPFSHQTIQQDELCLLFF